MALTERALTFGAKETVGGFPPYRANRGGMTWSPSNGTNGSGCRAAPIRLQPGQYRGQALREA
jgi:hypothetical protein